MMPTDAFEMALVHSIFRKELELAPALIRSVQPGKRGRLRRVAGHIANVLAALHHHHIAEDELLWPKLHDRIPMNAGEIQRMETEHEFIAKSAVSVKLRLAEWLATASATHLATHSRAAQMLISEIQALGDLVGDHLGAEEERIVPLINANLTDAEWRAVTERGGRFLSGRNIGFGLAFVGMVLEACTAEQRRRFLAGMPLPQRLLVKLFARRVAARYHARLVRTG